MVVPLDQSLEVDSAVHQAILHTEVVARGEGLVARGTCEAAEMVHRIPRSHNHLRRRYPEMATCAPLHGEPSETKIQLFKIKLRESLDRIRFLDAHIAYICILIC